MAKNLDENKQNPPAKLKEDFEREISLDQVQELKRILDQMQGIKVRAINLIAKLEHKE
jgi:hypothetical protein